MKYLSLVIKPKKIQIKTEGSALLVSIMLSGLMITVGIMSARLAVREVEMSADLFLSEKAYLSAESGVEKSLFKLKSDPLAHVQPSLTDGDINDLEDDFTEVSIRNLIIPSPTSADFSKGEFAFTLPPLQSQKFRFQQDTDLDINTSPGSINGGVTVALDSPGAFFWRFLCEDSGSGDTAALQAQSTGNIANLLTTNGVDDDGNPFTFNSWGSVDKNSCFLSVQNLAGSNRTYTFSGTTMAPHAAHIHAVGTHQGREKHIRFDYAQKSLGSLFDFSFLHSEGGL